MQAPKNKWIIIGGAGLVAIAGSAITQVFLLGHPINSVNPYALKAGTSLLAQGLSSNRMQYASMTTDTGKTEQKGKRVKLSFETLGGWTYLEGKTPIPDNVKQYNGKDVEISGFMMPLTQTDKITDFMLIQALWGCCYGRPPAVNHAVLVRMAQGRTVQFSSEPIRVRGQLSVGETRQDGYLVSLYQLSADEIVAR